MAEWLKSKESKIQGKTEILAKTKQDAAKARKQAETKVKEARAEAIRKKAEVVVVAPVVEAPVEGDAAATEEQA